MSINNAKEKVILVDSYDNEIGILDKYAAHQSPLLHRAVSVFIYNKDDELLIQQRSPAKYHSPLKWANTCCTHPRKDEATEEASCRRLKEEMGITAPLIYFDKLIYNSKIDELYEHEFVHIYIGRYNGPYECNSDEVSTAKWISVNKISELIENGSPEICKWLSEYYILLGPNFFKNMLRKI